MKSTTSGFLIIAVLGIMGFSAGGENALLASLFTERTYESVDAADRVELLPPLVHNCSTS